MGAIRTVIGIILILYGLVSIINGSFLIIGDQSPIGFDTSEADATISQFLPLNLFGVVLALWGLLWIVIGSKVMKGGQKN